MKKSFPLLVAAMTGLFPTVGFPDSLSDAKAQYDIADYNCRGGMGDDPNTMTWCDVRTLLGQIIASKPASDTAEQGAQTAAPVSVASAFALLEPSQRLFMQTVLRDNGFYTGPLDGEWGAGTEAAITAMISDLQRKNLLASHGDPAADFEDFRALLLETDTYMQEG